MVFGQPEQNDSNLPHSLDAQPLDPGLGKGLALIRAGAYFAAHEVLEDVWRAAEPAERDFYQGLVHVAVAWYQAGRKRPIATSRQLEKAVRRLTPYAPEHRGVAVEPLLEQLRELLATGSLDLPRPRL
jgi:predicted metal-dependent hydrolase